MNGTIHEIDPNKTKIITRTRPNIYYFFVFQVSLLFGSIYCIGSIYYHDIQGFFIGICFLLIGIPFSFWLTKVFAITFVEKFEKFMNIREKSEYW